MNLLSRSMQTNLIYFYYFFYLLPFVPGSHSLGLVREVHHQPVVLNRRKTLRKAFSALFVPLWMRKGHPIGIKLPLLQHSCLCLWHQLTVGHFFLWLLLWFYGQLAAVDSCFRHNQKGHRSVTKCQDGLKKVLVWSFARWMWKILNLEPKLANISTYSLALTWGHTQQNTKHVLVWSLFPH